MFLRFNAKSTLRAVHQVIFFNLIKAPYDHEIVAVFDFVLIIVYIHYLLLVYFYIVWAGCRMPAAI